MLSRINFLFLFALFAVPAFAEMPQGYPGGMGQPQGYGQPGISQLPQGGYGQGVNPGYGMPQYGGFHGPQGGAPCGQQRPMCGGQPQRCCRRSCQSGGRGCGQPNRGFASFSLALSFGGGGMMY